MFNASVTRPTIASLPFVAYVGDAMEESADPLCHLAGKLGVAGVVRACPSALGLTALSKARYAPRDSVAICHHGSALFARRIGRAVAQRRPPNASIAVSNIANTAGRKQPEKPQRLCGMSAEVTSATSRKRVLKRWFRQRLPCTTARVKTDGCILSDKGRKCRKRRC
jgi:hypothetical protein